MCTTEGEKKGEGNMVGNNTHQKNKKRKGSLKSQGNSPSIGIPARQAGCSITPVRLAATLPVPGHKRNTKMRAFHNAGSRPSARRGREGSWRGSGKGAIFGRFPHRGRSPGRLHAGGGRGSTTFLCSGGGVTDEASRKRTREREEGGGPRHELHFGEVGQENNEHQSEGRRDKAHSWHVRNQETERGGKVIRQEGNSPVIREIILRTSELFREYRDAAGGHRNGGEQG